MIILGLLLYITGDLGFSHLKTVTILGYFETDIEASSLIHVKKLINKLRGESKKGLSEYK